VRIAILSRGDGWHVQDLLRAACDLGVAAEALDFRRLLTDSLHGYDAVIVRTMPAGSLEQIVFRMDLLHAAEAKDVRVVNPPRAVETCVDKYLTNVRLEAAGLPIPKTIVCQTCDDAMNAFESLGRDVVVKPLFGSEGRGMVRLTDMETAWRVFHSLEMIQAVIYVQEFIRHPGWDVRAFVIDGKVVAAMKRTSRNDWRTNVAQGGSAEQYEVSHPVADLALAATKATGAMIAGVDLISNHTGQWQIIEVNAAPGWKALAAACNFDVARRVIAHAADVSR
jgi:ribosomal protein S6--L-glutamate ligase